MTENYAISQKRKLLFFLSFSLSNSMFLHYQRTSLAYNTTSYLTEILKKKEKEKKSHMGFRKTHKVDMAHKIQLFYQLQLSFTIKRALSLFKSEFPS